MKSLAGQKNKKPKKFLRKYSDCPTVGSFMAYGHTPDLNPPEI